MYLRFSQRKSSHLITSFERPDERPLAIHLERIIYFLNIIFNERSFERTHVRTLTKQNERPPLEISNERPHKSSKVYHYIYICLLSRQTVTQAILSTRQHF